MATYRVIAFNAEGQVMRDYTADVDAPDGPHFIAQQVLHGTDVECVEVRAPDGSIKLRQCGPGTDFDTIVKQEP
jgi:hypothetical protein